jgi:cyclohexanecarboxylate-CoA ligase
MSITARLLSAAHSSPRSRIIVPCADGEVADTNLGELWDESLRVAAGMRELGVEPGTVVAAQLPNWRECLITHSAAWLCGAVLLPIIPIYGTHEVAYILRQSRAKLFVAAGRWRGQGVSGRFGTLDELEHLEHRVVVGGTPVPGSVAYADLAAPRTESFEPHAPGSEDERCLLVYTSGTTAAPKGVQHTHATLLGEIQSAQERRGARPDAAGLAAFPSGHIAGALGILRMLTRTGLTVVMDKWDPVEAVRLIATHQIQSSAGAPIYLNGILDVADDRGVDLSCLDEYTTGAANVSPELIRRADRRGIAAFRCYGSTEHPTISSGVPEDPLDKRALTDGRLMPGTEIRLIDDDGRDVARGSDGEILSRGPELFVGYTDSGLNRTSFVEGWFRTGDIGRLDADGYLCITDRKKDIIVRGGENISSKEVEDALLEHPAVAQVAAVATPDERYGERVCVFVVLRAASDISLPEIRAHFEAQGMARQKTPERLEVVDELPRNPSGKVQKQVLRSALQAERTGQASV